MQEDIWVNLYSDTTGQVKFSFSVEGTGVTRVKGKTRVLMQWLKALLTAPGSNLFDLNYGTVFNDLLNANVVDTGLIREIGIAGIDQATELIKDKQRSSRPSDEEKLKSSELLSFEKVSDTSVSFVVSLINARGESMLVGIRTGK